MHKVGHTAARNGILPVMALIALLALGSGGWAQDFVSVHQEHEALFGPTAPAAQVETTAAAVPARYLQQGSTSLNRMKQAGKVFFGYHPYWVDGDEDQYRYDLISHLCYFDVGINYATGAIDNTPSGATIWYNRSGYQNLRTYCTQFDVTLVLGAVLFGDADIASFLDNPAARSAAISGLLSEVQAGSAQGINIDFEFVPTTHAAKFTAFMQDLADAFHAVDPDYHISIAAYAAPSSRLEEDKLVEILDHMFMMNYNYHWSGSTASGPCSTLETSDLYGGSSTLDAIRDHIRDGLDPAKLVPGLAWYGYEYPCASDQPGATVTGSSSTLIYDTVLTTRWSAYGKRWDWNGDQNYYAYYDGSDWRQGWCDDPVSWRRRCEMVKRSGVVGMGCWALGYSSTSTDMYPQVWQALQETWLDGPDYILDDFELWDSNWADPNTSGQSVGDTDNDSTFAQSTDQVHGAGSLYSAKFYYDFENPTGFLRQYYSSAALEGRGYVDTKGKIHAWIYGDNSGNQIRLCVRDGEDELEASAYTTINWTGWQKLEWDLANDAFSSFATGDGAIDGAEVKVDSFQLNYPGAGGSATGTIYIDDLGYTPGENVVTVGASGADFTDIQTAIDSFGQADGISDVVELVDASYTVGSPLTVRKDSGKGTTDTLILRGAPGVNPVIVASNPTAGGAAILVDLDGDVEIGSANGTLTIIPAAGINSDTYALRADEENYKINITLENVVISSNNGSNAAGTNGTAAAGGSDTQFAGGFQLYSGPLFNYGNNGWLDTVTVAGTSGGPSLNRDGVENYGDGDFGLWILPNCRFSYNGGNGVYSHTKYTELLGTRAEPILIHNNDASGIYQDGESQIHRMEHVAAVENGANGWNVASASASSDTRVERSAFAQNTATNVYIADASALAYVFNNCTFHDADGSSDDIGLADAADATSVNLNGCVITGNGPSSPSDTVYIHSSSTGTVQITESSLVLSGPDSLLTTYNGLYGNTGNVTQTTVINDDPVYVSEFFNNGANPDYLDVQNPAYATAGIGGAILSGYGDYVALTGVTIDTDPVSQIIPKNGSVTFTVAASGSAPISYQWKKVGVGDILGADTDSYTINPVTESDAGDYYCTVSNLVNSADSATATLTVTPPTRVEDWQLMD